MRVLEVTAVMGVIALVGLAVACGSGDDEGDVPAASSGGSEARVQFDGRAAQFTPTPAAAQAAATQGSIIQYAGGYRGGTETLTAPQALDNVGKNTKVCGLVVSSVHEPEHTFKLTTLYIDKAEDPDFVVYFWHSPLRIGDWPDHADSSIDLTTWFNGKRICVEGRIELYRGTPSINASRWHQYELIQE